MKTLAMLLVSFVLIHALSLDYEKWAKDLEVMIKLDMKAHASVAGEDLNKNQIRDDVEEYVNKKYKNDEFQKVMFLEAARKIQQILTLPKNAPKKLHKKLDKELIQIYTCRDFILFKYLDVDLKKEYKNKIEFKSVVLNTPKRIQAYIAHKKMVPFEYDIPSDKELDRQKKECEKIYAKIKKNQESKKLSKK